MKKTTLTFTEKELSNQCAFRLTLAVVNYNSPKSFMPVYEHEDLVKTESFYDVPELIDTCIEIAHKKTNNSLKGCEALVELKNSRIGCDKNYLRKLMDTINSIKFDDGSELQVCEYVLPSCGY